MTNRSSRSRAAALAAFMAGTLLLADAAAQAPAPKLVDFPATAIQQHASARDIATEAGRETLRALRADARVKTLDVGLAAAPAVVATRRFRLELPGPRASVEVDDLEHTRHDGFDHLYRFDTETGDETSLVVDGPNLLGWIRSGGETLSLVPLGNGATAIARYDSGGHRHESGGHRHPHQHDDWLPELQPKLDEEARDAGELLERARHALRATPDDETTIDVLVVYTPAARTRVGNERGSMHMLTSQTFVNANRLFERSGIATRIRVAHAEEVDYTESPRGIKGDMCHLTNHESYSLSCQDPDHDDAALDEVQDLREEHGADLVTFIVDAVYHDGDPAGIAGLLGAYSIVSAVAQAAGGYIMTHEIGHNLGGMHNPGNRPPGEYVSRPYGHGRCNTAENWHTLMSTAANGPPDYVLCAVGLPLLSGPRIIGPNGTPTGDTHTHDVARLFTETTPMVAKYRTHKPRGTLSHLVPFVPRQESANGLHAFVRIINYSAVGERAKITVTDDDGLKYDTWLDIEPGMNQHFNSHHLEQGYVRGLGPGIGPTDRAMRLVLTSGLDLSVLAYARTGDGFVTSLHETARKWRTATGSGALIEFFNPGSNRRIASVLRVINLEDRDLAVTVHGYDDKRTPRTIRELSLDYDHAAFTLGPHEARNIPSWTLEERPILEGGLGDGAGKWILVVAADGDFEAMSLLHSEAGYITNVSR